MDAVLLVKHITIFIIITNTNIRAGLRGCGACSKRNSEAPIQRYIFCNAIPHFP